MKNILIIAILFALGACHDRPKTKTYGVAGKTFTLEVADTDDRRMTGLMYRKEMPKGRGMIFVFDEPGEHAMWMKNTLIPLDMLFLDSDKKVIAIAKAREPHNLSLTTACSAIFEESGVDFDFEVFVAFIEGCERGLEKDGRQTKYVVELNAGEAAGIKRGDIFNERAK